MMPRFTANRGILYYYERLGVGGFLCRFSVNWVMAGVPFAGLQVDGIIVFLFLVPGIDHCLVVYIAIDHGRGDRKGGGIYWVVRGVLFLTKGVQGGLIVDGGLSVFMIFSC